MNKKTTTTRNKIVLAISVIALTMTMVLMSHSAYGLMSKEKLAEMVKEKNEQDGITPESIAKKEQEDWNKYLEAREYNSVSPYEKRFLEITNEHHGTNYTTLEEAMLGGYERYLDELSLYEWRMGLY